MFVSDADEGSSLQGSALLQRNCELQQYSMGAM